MLCMKNSPSLEVQFSVCQWNKHRYVPCLLRLPLSGLVHDCTAIMARNKAAIDADLRAQGLIYAPVV